MAGEGVEEDLVNTVVDRVAKINEEQFKSMMETMNANMIAQFKLMMANTTPATQMTSVTEPEQTVEEHTVIQAPTDHATTNPTQTPTFNASQTSSEYRVLVKPQEPPSFASCTKPYMIWRREVMTWKKMMEMQKVDSRQLAYKVISSMDASGNTQGSRMKLKGPCHRIRFFHI